MKDAFGPKKPTTKAAPPSRLAPAPQTKAKAKAKTDAASGSTASQSSATVAAPQLPIGKKTEPAVPAMLLPRPPSLYNPAAVQKQKSDEPGVTPK